MKNTLMITASVVALIAAGGLASAQGTNEHREQPAAAAPEQKAPVGKGDRQNVKAPEKSQPAKPAPSAKLPEKSDPVKPAPSAKLPEKSDPVKPAPSAKLPEKSEPSAKLPEKPTGAKSGAAGPGGGTQPSQHDAQAPSGRTVPNAAAQPEAKAGAPAALSTEHHAQIREAIRGEKVAPLSDVRFSITIGEAVPPTVHLNRLPARIIEYAPQYRGYEYILVGDHILIVDPRTLRIVAVIPA
jgi:outer membrane biosynthesis protein TonB